MPKNFYSIRFYTEHMIEYIDSNHGDRKPFFGYLAYTASHWTLMAPDESIAKYKGRYDEGYTEIHKQRLARIKKLGLLPGNEYVKVKIAKDWEELSKEERVKEARAMEIHAAMIGDIDDYIGQLLDHLKLIGALENTLIIFISDNGDEGHDFSQIPVIADWSEQCCDNSLDNMWKTNSSFWYGPGWGTVSSTPLGGSKGFPRQGGFRVRVLMIHPEISGNQINREPITLMEIMPTILEAADIKHPAPHCKGRDVEAMRGTSMWPRLKGDVERVHPED